LWTLERGSIKPINLSSPGKEAIKIKLIVALFELRAINSPFFSKRRKFFGKMNSVHLFCIINYPNDNSYPKAKRKTGNEPRDVGGS
jgi:hypothetical protein